MGPQPAVAATAILTREGVGGPQVLLVQRRPDPCDSRAKLLDFTGKGEALVDELARSTARVWAQYAELIGERKLQQTMRGLQYLLEATQVNQES